MAEETDGIEEAFEGQLRVLVTAAGQVAEQIARGREEALRRAQAQSEQEARQLQSRLAAEQRTARAELANVHRSDWWDRATPEVIGRTYQVARAWSQEDSEAVRAEQRMNDELRTRYGVDVNSTNADPAAVRAAVERAEQERAQADAERTRAASENAEAQRLVAQANQEDQRAAEARAAAEYEPDPDERARALAEAETPLGPLRPYTDEERASLRIETSNEEARRLNLWAEERSTRSGVARDEAALRYDSAERREGTAQHERTADRAREDGKTTYDSADRRSSTATELERRGIAQETVATRMRADVSQAKPATAAVAAGKTKAAKARKTRGRGAQVQRTGLDR